MQVCSRSAREGFIYYTVTALITPIAQWLFYGRHATAVRVGLLTVLVIALADASRHTARWFSHVRVPGGSAQPHRSATLAALCIALLSMLATYTLQVLIYGTTATLIRAGGLALALYGLSRLLQHWQAATLEVSLDFLVSILVNLGGQRLIYGTLASAEVMTTFTAVFLPLAYLRRFGTRLLFSALIPAGQVQPWWQAALEVTGDTLLALLMAYGLQVLWYGTAATLDRAGSLTVALYTLTLLRRYVLRRIFEAWRVRQLARPPSSEAPSMAMPGPPA